MPELGRTQDAVAGMVDAVAATCDEPDTATVLAALATAIRAEAAHRDDRLATLCQALGLSPFERDLLVLAGLPEEHEAVTRVARLLHPVGEPRFSFAGVVRVLGLDARGRRHLRAALESGPLRHHHLIAGLDTTPLPERGLHLTKGLWSVLRGVDHWPEETSSPEVAPLASPALAPAALDAALEGGRVVIVVAGGPSRPAIETAGLVAAALDDRMRAWVAVDGATLDPSTADLWSAHLLARGAVPIVVAPGTAPLPRHPHPVLVCVSSTTGAPMDDRPTISIELDDRELGEAVVMWNDLLPELNGEADRLAGLLRIDHVRAGLAVGDARAASAARGEPVTVRGVIGGVRRRTNVTLPPSIRLVKPDARWDDLVVAPDQEAQLHSVIERMLGQVRVLHDWGFSATRGTRGVRMLLSGPPGTGKTLTAEVMASELGIDLLVVDLAALVSKWIGETEKNIGEVFDAAERCQAVLLFDEADAIFGRRTDAGDAQARWANVETAYLLGRIDRFDGLVALATNLRSNIDDAFVRRLDVIVELDEPDLAERTRLWHNHLPPDAPLGPDVDIPQLAALYPVTGGLIRNAALAAAFAAAGAGGPIGQEALVRAIRREYQKAGRSFPGVPRSLTALARGGR
jgi:hypothetical protein